MTAPLLLMVVIGIAIGAAGCVQFVRAGRAARRRREAAAYRERLAGVMLVALGMILITFAVTYTTVTHSHP